MIAADAAASFDRLARRLIDRARALAEARAAETLLARRGDPARWRKARLLWPQFTQG
ncbi:MAG: hypothetical protein KGL44_02655 [Sphingomonadales bacterium]|nr:hypothetical protein [Sphingomonadales bacterium]